MRLDPLLTSAPVTGAIRPITEDLLRDVYIAPKPLPWLLREALEGRSSTPWGESLAAAPDETAAAVEAALVSVMRAVPTLDPAALVPEALPEGRAGSHLSALRDLWRELGALPPPLDAVAHVLRSEARDALEPLPLLEDTPCPHADAVERALADHLRAHHGSAPDATAAVWRARQASREGAAPGSLGTVQRGLGRAAEPGTADGSLRLYGVRDPREEAELAAARTQRMLEEGALAAPSEIGILAPEDPAYALALAEAFDRVGLPLSGLPEIPAQRDAAGEILSAALAILQGPAPRTALATLYAHPAMPWPHEVGRQMAREVIESGWSRAARTLREQGITVLDALRPASTPEQLIARLFVLAEAMPQLGLAPRINGLRTALSDGIDWPMLRRLVEPRILPADGTSRFVEGVSLFSETALPWRPVRHLIVLGLTGRAWPRMPAASPLFTEGEIVAIRDATGLHLPGRRERLARGLELFRRQLCAATEGVTLTAPARDLRGERQPPTTALALITHLLGAKAPEDLLTEVRALPPKRWPVAHELPAPLPDGCTPDLPSSGVLRLGSDLLRLREADEGHRVPQSPSRLETLLVSPLAWVLDELGATDRSWAPEALDVLTLGSVMHKLIELLFPEATPIADDDALRTRLPAALDSAIAAEASWLAGPDWAAERASLLREGEATALAWARFLRESGAQILKNEIELAGDHGGLLIRGRADCVLRLPDGRLLVVDHKRASARARRERMTKGWDLQVALYRAMLERPSTETLLTDLVRSGAQSVTAYHTMLDRMVLVDAGGAGIAGAEAATSDISEQALALLAERVAEVGSGTVRLNSAGDLARFSKDCGITAYALKEAGLATVFLMPEDDIAEELAE